MALYVSHLDENLSSSCLDGSFNLINNFNRELDNASVELPGGLGVGYRRSHVERISCLHRRLKRPGDFKQSERCSIEQTHA